MIRSAVYRSDGEVIFMFSSPTSTTLTRIPHISSIMLSSVTDKPEERTNSAAFLYSYLPNICGVPAAASVSLSGVCTTEESSPMIFTVSFTFDTAIAAPYLKASSATASISSHLIRQRAAS